MCLPSSRNASHPTRIQSKDLLAAGPASGFEIDILNAGSEAEIKTAFATLAQRRVGALIVVHRGQGVCDLLRSALGDPRDMRKNISFAIAATMLGLAMIFWAGSSVVSAEIVRTKVVLSSQVVTPSSYLPTQVVEPI